MLGMFARPLRQEHDARDDEDTDDERGHRTAERKPAMVQGLVEEIADRGPERAGEDLSLIHI